MTGLNDCGCRPRCNRWGPVWRRVDKRGRISNRRNEKTADQIEYHPLFCILEPLESIVRPEWEGQFPVARINWFEVYTACTKVLGKISAVHCDDPQDLMSAHFHDTRDARLTRGVGAVEAFLAMAQQLGRPAFKLDHATGIGIAGNAIRETFKGETASAE